MGYSKEARNGKDEICHPRAEQRRWCGVCRRCSIWTLPPSLVVKGRIALSQLEAKKLSGRLPCDIGGLLLLSAAPLPRMLSDSCACLCDTFIPDRIGTDPSVPWSNAHRENWGLIRCLCLFSTAVTSFLSHTHFVPSVS